MKRDQYEAVVLSIKPKYADMIRAGTKKYEFRRRVWTGENIKFAFLYESVPVKSIRSVIVVDPPICLPINELWEHTKERAGITREEFDEYFKGSENGYAIPIKEIRDLLDLKIASAGMRRPPLNFSYIDLVNQSFLFYMGVFDTLKA